MLDGDVKKADSKSTDSKVVDDMLGALEMLSKQPKKERR